MVTIMTVLLIMMSIICSIAIFGVYNLTKTNEDLYEANQDLSNANDILVDKLDSIRLQVMEIESQLVELDVKGAFEADDEVGFFFKEIRMLNQDLQNTIREQYGESSEA